MNKAHSRICLIGEDLDWTGGKSILAPINLNISTQILKNNRNYIEVVSNEKNLKISLEDLSEYTYKGSFFDYIIAGLNTFSEYTKVKYSGMKIIISSDIPIQSGLSSSASLLISLFRELSYLHNCNLDDDYLCFLGKKTESITLNAVVGTMDFFACARNKIILFDENRNEVKEYDYHFDEDVSILIIYSGKSSSTKEINAEKKIRFLKKEKNFMLYLQHGEKIVNKLDYLLTSEAPIKEIGKTIYEAHKIMDKYLQNTNDSINNIVDLCMNNGAYGAKLTGCGFGGYVFCMIPTNKLNSFCEILNKNKLEYLRV